MTTAVKWTMQGTLLQGCNYEYTGTDAAFSPLSWSGP